MTKKELTKLLKENSEVREALLAAVGGAVGRALTGFLPSS